MNIAIENGYDHILYSFKKKELIQRDLKKKDSRNFVFNDQEEELWIDIPHQKYVTLVEDDRQNVMAADNGMSEVGFSRVTTDQIFNVEEPRLANTSSSSAISRVFWSFTEHHIDGVLKSLILELVVCFLHLKLVEVILFLLLC